MVGGSVPYENGCVRMVLLGCIRYKTIGIYTCNPSIFNGENLLYVMLGCSNNISTIYFTEGVIYTKLKYLGNLLISCI